MFKLVVLFSVLALAAAKPAWAPWDYSAVVPAVHTVTPYSSQFVHGSHIVPTYYGAYSPYVPGVVPAVSALAQAPNSPAVVLDAVRGVPLDTPEVVSSRIAHYQAKALAGAHHVGKRSVVPVTYSQVVSPVAAVSPFSSYHGVVGYSSPFVSAYSTPFAHAYGYPSVVPKALSVHPW